MRLLQINVLELTNIKNKNKIAYNKKNPEHSMIMKNDIKENFK